MILSCIIFALFALLGFALYMLYIMYWYWRRDFTNRVTRDHKSSPSNMKKPGPRKLDLDHIYLSFSDYLWVSIFVGLPADVNWAVGLVVLKFREKFCRIQNQPDYNALCAQVVLGTHYAIYFTKFVEEPDFADVAAGSLSAVAEFCLEDFTYVVNNKHGGLEMRQGRLRILIQLDKDESSLKERHRLLKAWIGSKELSAQEVYMFITLKIFSSGHVALHALSNWGVNPENYAHPFLRRMSTITVMYNYYGLNSFNSVILFLQRYFKPFKYIHREIDALPTESHDGHIHRAQGHVHLFNSGVKGGVVEHSKSVLKLMPYSHFVSFIANVRQFFGEEFKKHEKDFPGVDVEALFAGTIMHSLDHTQCADIMKDPLWYRRDNSRPKTEDDCTYEWLEEWCRFSRSGFVDDLPGILFKYKYKDAPHPFFKAVYEFAYKIDPYLAGSMDGCIIK